MNGCCRIFISSLYRSEGCSQIPEFLVLPADCSSSLLQEQQIRQEVMWGVLSANPRRVLKGKLLFVNSLATKVVWFSSERTSRVSENEGVSWKNWVTNIYWSPYIMKGLTLYFISCCFSGSHESRLLTVLCNSWVWCVCVCVCLYVQY
jgi:hypothetical protein